MFSNRILKSPQVSALGDHAATENFINLSGQITGRGQQRLNNMNFGFECRLIA
jgi:hypothetical protein